MAEQIRLILMGIFVLPIKALLGGSCLILCWITFHLVDLLPQRWHRAVCATTGKLWCR
jgi:hypothetical protein